MTAGRRFLWKNGNVRSQSSPVSKESKCKKNAPAGATRGVLMLTFPVWSFRFSRFMAQFFAKGSELKRQFKRNIISTVFLAVTTLGAIAARNGQQITFIPNGTFFGNPVGESET